MRIAAVRLKNFMRFRGEHEVRPPKGVSAVVAEWEGEPQRSNWGGKTSLLEAIAFALYGRHRFLREDDWITRGENVGSVEVLLDDGTSVRRERKRGKSTQLTVLRGMDERGGVPRGTAKANGDEAQKLVEQIVGLGEDDFFATCFLAQKQMSRLVLARPAERMEIVSGWLGLARLQACEEHARELLSQASARLADAERQIEVAKLSLDGKSVDECEKQANELGEVAKEKRRLLVEGEAKLEAAHAARDDRKAAEEYARVVEAGKTLKSTIKVDPVKAEAEKAEAIVAESEAGREVRRLKVLAAGEFDGKCPVADITCPAKRDINQMRAEHRVMLKKAEERHKATAAAAEAARAEADVVLNRVARLESLRSRALELQPAAKRAAGSPPIEVPDLAPLRDEAARADSAARVAASTADQARRAAERLQTATAAAEAAKAEMVTLREAVAVFGRGGAQKLVAESALTEIGDGANALLAEAGIPLQVAVSWAREGQGLAPHCGTCGMPFQGQRAGACGRCGAERGPKMVERLDVELSDRSGAAEDVAGIAIQVSAATWLRRERGASWGVCIVDEPFSACDPANRGALARVLATMLGSRFAFEQALVVSHTPDTVDMMPGRIEIRAGENGSRFA